MTRLSEERRESGCRSLSTVHCTPFANSAIAIVLTLVLTASNARRSVPR
jgi:hypothetical protein